ncbi:MAG: penicillin-binding transpeptidase domain-containing protein, partial [Bacillota bacterium]|nr:penicillin-binding transpeptidase domain-containing protein [Bacillota bacterium]
DIPLSYNEGQLIYEKGYTSWLEENDIGKDLTEKELLVELFHRDGKYLRRLLGNSEGRRFIYRFLDSRNYIENIEINNFSFVYDEEYNQLKNKLVKEVPNVITMDSEAKDDFIALVRKYSTRDLFRSIYSEEDSNILPGVLLYEEIKEIYPDLPIDYVEDDGRLYFNYLNEEEKMKFLAQNNLPEETTAFDIVLELAEKENLDYNVITSDDVKYYAQTELLKYINPEISVSSWEYTAILQKNNWVEANLDPGRVDSKPKEIFYSLRDKAGLDDSISNYEARYIFVLRERYLDQGYRAYYPIDICYDASEKTVALISENSEKLNGVDVITESVRYYPFRESAAHIMGYMGKISQDYEIEKYIEENNYSRDDLIGKTGIEEKFEDLLSGKKGSQTLEVDAYGNRIKVTDVKEPVPGGNLHLTLDIELQQKAEVIFKYGLEEIQKGGTFESKWGDFDFEDSYDQANSGALVVVDVETGEIISMVNYPSYDPNLFSTGITSENWEGLMNESENPLAPKPLYNISMLTEIQPGSTFKMVTSLAALQKGISPYEEIYGAGFMEIGNQQFGCWIWNMYKGQHGYENMYEAIRDSCNYYFYTLVLGENPVTKQRVSQRVTLEDILAMAKELGLGEKTGIEIDLPYEASGGLPNPDTKAENARYYLKIYLTENIDKFYKDDITFNSDEKEQLINEIVSWISTDEPLTRREVYDGLELLGINPDRTNNYGIPITDIIKYTYLNSAIWNYGDTMNISIGQGDNSYTPLQMARYTAALANGGYRKNLSIIKKGTDYTEREILYQPVREEERINIDDYEYMDDITKGMMLVAEDSRIYRDFPITVAAKTGTAEKDGVNPETGTGFNDFGWYVAFAPAENPKIAIASVIFQGGSGRYPSPLVREIIGEYFKLEPEEEE